MNIVNFNINFVVFLCAFVHILINFNESGVDFFNIFRRIRTR